MSTDQRKRLETLKAIAALHGVVVHELKDDVGNPEYITTKWHLTKSHSSLDGLDDWLTMVTGKVASS